MRNEKSLTILGHLAELKSRLIRAVIAVVAGSLVAFLLADYIFAVLTLPTNNYPLIYIDMTEMIGAYMKVCLAAGIALAMPYLVYQGVMFIAPAMTPKEKRYICLVLPWIFLMFVGGIAFSYFVLLPPATNFLITFGSEIATPQIRIGSYLTVVTRVMLGTGISFELPVITTFLARIGIVSSRWLAGKRKIAIVLSFILAAFITPTFDPINQALVALPLVVLYEMSIWLAKLVQPRQAKMELAVSAPIA